MDYSIGIVTYVKRFENYFQPLLEQIKEARPESEIIVCVNGQYKEGFDQQYRKKILQFISKFDNVFVTIHPEFRSLSKLWNTCLINSTKEKMLLLNDDITIKSKVFFNNLENYSKYSNRSFKINGSWSHTFLLRNEISEIGWFDERFLGVGEEDGDFEWRYQNKKNIPFQNLIIEGIINHVEQKDCLQNMKIIHNKYSQFNKKFSDLKYKEDLNGKNYGIMNRKLLCVDETTDQYPNEKFYWLNKDKL
jgi:hypothetical protein